jgi:rRNA processing protein Krr1/Pno1
MSGRFNNSNMTTIPATVYGLPIGVIIGKKGVTIKTMQYRSGATIKVKDGNIHITGGHKQVVSAKALLNELASNFQNGIIGFNVPVLQNRARKPKPAVRISEDGWTTTGEAKKTEPQPTRNISNNNNGQFAGLDFSDSDDEEPAIKLTISEKTNEVSPKMAEFMKELAAKEEELAGMSNDSWADACDIDDVEDDIARLKKYLCISY